MPDDLHRLTKAGDLERLRILLKKSAADINTFDAGGFTALMHAAQSPRARVELVELLLDNGADLHLTCKARFEADYSVAALAIKAGDLRKVQLLVERAANLGYRRTEGFDALMDAVYGSLARDSADSMDLLKFLLAQGVALNTLSSYGESALRALSGFGRFEAVRLLLDAGADESQLDWTPLIRAVAIGSLADVKALVAAGAKLEEKDRCQRTAWLVAVQMGDISKAEFLLASGALTGPGAADKPALFYAIENHRLPMLKWLLDMGAAIDETNEFGTTAAMTAAEHGNAEALAVLIEAGADIHATKPWNQSVLSDAKTRETAAILLQAGADPAHLAYEGRRALLGLPPEPDEALLRDVTPEQYRRGRTRRFGAGTSNPEEFSEPFWEGMIRAGVIAYQGALRFGDGSNALRQPVWCAQRFGQSFTILPDGRIVQIGGEHEDSYDPDFCIYNDVFLHEPDGAIRIFGYPEAVFPPTDFHTATLVDDSIYIIGSLGYQGTRQFGTTPIYRLDTKTFRMTKVDAGGEAPGWIYKHRATLRGSEEIVVSGGTIVTWDGRKEVNSENQRSFVLNVRRLAWYL